MSNISIIEVFISDSRVGRMALTPEGLCGFEYDTDWIQAGFSISSFYLPLKPGLTMAKRDPFEGNFGVFDDCYFGVERFVRTPQGKIHTISAAGLLQANYRNPSLELLSATETNVKSYQRYGAGS